MANFAYLDSAFVGPFYEWFVDLGYPQCDLVKLESGEWGIIEMLNAPLCPSMTQWRYIAQGFRNIEPTMSRCKKILEDCDPTRRALWDREEEKTRKVEADHAAREERAELVADELTASITRNPDLRERIAKRGLTEMLPHKIAENLTDSQRKGA